MNRRISKKSEIKGLKEINGVNIEELNRRCRPIISNRDDPFWRFRSFEGFIASGEDLKEVLTRDWELVEEMGSSHLQIAEILSEIISQTERIRRERDAGPMKSISIQFPTRSFPLLFESSEKDQEFQQLLVHRQIFNGDQFSPFWNESISKPEEEEETELEEDGLNTRWREEWTIEHPKLGISIKVAIGIVQFIRQLGFYEGGGVQNPYRIHPLLVASISSGKVNEKVLELIKIRFEEGWRMELEEVSHLQNEIQNQKDAQTLEWIVERIKMLEKTIETKKKESKEALRTLKN